MDDFWKALGWGMVALAGFHFALEGTARQAAKQQVLTAFHHIGTVHIDLRPRGALGLLANQIWSLDVSGDGQKTDDLPFYVVPRSGWKGTIRHLRLHYSHFVLNGYPVSHMEADVPFVTYDLSNAILKDRLVIRSAGRGPAYVELSAQDLQTFITKKYNEILSDVNIELQNKRIYLHGALTFFGSRTPVSADGTLVLREGRYLDLADAHLLLSSLAVQPSIAAIILERINPVLDTRTDMHLDQFFTMETSEIGDDRITVRGTVTVPPISVKPKENNNP